MTKSQNSVITLENVTVKYGAGTPFERVALDGVNISFPKNKITGIIGHTGSGKSTLATLLNGLLKPTAGVIRLEGEDIHRDKEFTNKIRFQVGLVFQYPEYQLFEETLERDIGFGPRNMGLSDDEIARRVEKAAEFTGLDAYTLKSSPFEISGGQKRRAAIAGVIAMEPSVLVLDEPAAGLDPMGKEEILGGLCDYKKKTLSTLLLISHNMEDIAKYADYILVLKEGKVFKFGSVAEIFSEADDLFNSSLDVPQITKLFIELKKRNVIDRTDIYTVGYGARAILAKLGESGL
ncbi:MAG: energy-coupling factor transporter ATPase [Eubacteriales bacterium]